VAARHTLNLFMSKHLLLKKQI